MHSHHLLFTIYYLLLTTNLYVLLGSNPCLSLLATNYLLLTTCYSVLATQYLLLSTCYSLLTTHYSERLLTAYNLLLTEYS